MLDTITNHRYSQEVTYKKVALIGPIPPPIGGVSVHIKRVQKELQNTGNIVVIFDSSQYKTKLSRYWFLAYFMLKNRPDEVHYHTLYNSIAEWIITICFKFFLRYKLVTIDHDCRYLKDKTLISRFILRYSHRWVDQQIFMGNTVKDSYLAHRIPILVNHRLESPFIAPCLQEEQAITETYPESLHKFLKNRRPLIIVNA
ncbi:MAG TPA: hypothetical protein VHA52_07875, partial [Candidatus Babeliaceae bacterium]|nr:hypothetical protein [Candidatus Babeliaceae bacterium]